MANIERKWTLRTASMESLGQSALRPIAWNGPPLAKGETVEVVPAEQLRGAVERAEEAERQLAQLEGAFDALHTMARNIGAAAERVTDLRGGAV